MVALAVPSQNDVFFDQLSQNMMTITQIVLGTLVKTTAGEVNNFSNFSCMFLTPNNFFQFEY